MVNRRPQLSIVAPDASPEEAAAVIAALTQFMRDTAPSREPSPPQIIPWLRAALEDGVDREPPFRAPWA